MAVMAMKTAKWSGFLALLEARDQIGGCNGGWSSEFTPKMFYEPQRGRRSLLKAPAPHRRQKFLAILSHLKIF